MMSFRLPDVAERCGGLALRLFLLLLVGLLPATAGAAPSANAIVRPDPIKSSVAVGQIVTINLYVQDVTDLYGADVRLSFDPEILQVVDDAPATAGVQITPLSSFLKPDFVVRKKACNGVDASDPDCTGGGLVWYAATQVNPSQPVSGSGSLAAVRFRRIKAGDTLIAVIHNELVTRTGTTIPSEVRDGTVSTATSTTRYLYLPIVGR
jgi:hypothetical protein